MSTIEEMKEQLEKIKSFLREYPQDQGYWKAERENYIWVLEQRIKEKEAK
jgi:hypothetical protein